MLPKSCTLSDSLLDVGLLPASGYVYEGTLGGSKVRIQRVRIHPERDHRKVHVCPDATFPCSEALMNLADLLPSGRYAETPHTSEHRPACWCYNRPLPVHFGLDAGRDLVNDIVSNPDADRSSLVSVPSTVLYDDLPHNQLSDTAEGLNYLHSRNVIHGYLKGVCSV